MTYRRFAPLSICDLVVAWQCRRLKQCSAMPQSARGRCCARRGWRCYSRPRGTLGRRAPSLPQSRRPGPLPRGCCGNGHCSKSGKAACRCACARITSSITSTWLIPWLVRLRKSLQSNQRNYGCSDALKLCSVAVWLPRRFVLIVPHSQQEAADLFAEAAAENPQDGRTWMGAALLARRRNMWQVCLPPHNIPVSC